MEVPKDQVKRKRAKRSRRSLNIDSELDADADGRNFDLGRKGRKWTKKPKESHESGQVEIGNMSAGVVQSSERSLPPEGRLNDGRLIAKRKKGRKLRRKREIMESQNLSDGDAAGFTMFKSKGSVDRNLVHTAAPNDRSAPLTASRPLSFLEKMRARLSGGRFRMLNETLYTCRGEEAYELFRRDPAAFTLYHTGYQEQMTRWPVLPVEVVIGWLKSRSQKLVVADFGCGDARLAKSVKNKVFSLDLIATDPSVIACNMAQTPLDTSSVDVAVFCLSLMGTDYPSFLQEANRVLKSSGTLLIAEIKSRFDIDNGGASPQQFISALQSLGFSLISQDFSNKMFIMFYLRKQKGLKNSPKPTKQWPELKACIYKRR